MQCAAIWHCNNKILLLVRQLGGVTLKALRILILLAICLTISPAKSDQYRVQANQHAPGVDDPIGCYWMSGQRFCTRYCYWEVDGVRYCREGEFLAVPQGPIQALPRQSSSYAPYKY